MPYLPFLLILLAVVEIMLFMWAGQYIGFWTTIFLVLASAFIGSFLVRAQGMQALANFRQSLARGEGTIGLSLFTGVCLLLAGAFLITPGFITDTFGMLLLIPPLRARAYAGLKSRFASMVGSGSFSYQSYSGRGGDSTTIIDVEGEEKP